MDEKDIIKILVASDVHLGYKEDDTIRGEDSFNSFEEVFTIAKDKNVDFVLLGGDLFHANRPSRQTLHSCMEIMKKYCLGDRPCKVKVLSDQKMNFGHTSKTVKTVNYEDPNIKVSMPVFSIHGNHDDPAGSGFLSAIDLLSVAGYLNHFGRTRTREPLEIEPVLLEKGATKIALYGLGSIRDTTLIPMFQKKKVKFVRPTDDKWFNIMVIHQNRYRKDCIREDFLDKFLDLVIWGHEHECIGKLEENSTQTFSVLQPGSTVATSLKESEMKKKHVVLLEVCKKKIKPPTFIELKTVRNMYVETVSLREDKINPIAEDIKNYLSRKVEHWIKESKRNISGHPKQPIPPLIRLRVDCSGYSKIPANPLRGVFKGKVANDNEIIRYLKNRNSGGQSGMTCNRGDQTKKIGDYVQEYLLKGNSLSFLSAQLVTLSVQNVVDGKDGTWIVQDVFDDGIEEVLKHMKEKFSDTVDDGHIKEGIINYRKQRKAEGADDKENLQVICERVRRKARNKNSVASPLKTSASGQKRIVPNSGADTPSSSTIRGGPGRGRANNRGRGGYSVMSNRTSIAAMPVKIKAKIKNEPEILTIVLSSSSEDDCPQAMDSTSSQRERSPAKRARSGQYDSDENPGEPRRKR